MSPLVASSLVALLVLPPAASTPADSDLPAGIRQVEEGRFEDAALTLDSVVRRLTDHEGSSAELAQAHLYLGVAEAGLDHADRAKEHFRAALRADKSVALPPAVATPAAQAAFEAARKAGKGAGKTLLLVGAGGAVAAGVAIAVTGGSSAPPATSPVTTLPAGPTPTPPPLPARPSDLVASVSSPQTSKTFNCRVDVIATVTLSNGSASPVTVEGILKTTTVALGGCNPAPDYTYRPLASKVAGGETATVFQGPLYTNGAGCCYRGRVCDGSNTCAIEETFFVETSVGQIRAGSFGYRVNFLDCVACESVNPASCGAQSVVP